MKSIFGLLILCLITLSIYGQPGNCRGPMPESLFRQKHKAIMMQKSENLKLDMANILARQNCMNAEQVKSIAMLFIDDFSRLEFARNAFENTVDKENYYFVYDAFAYISTVFMLHDHVLSYQPRPHDYLPPYEPPLNLNFAALDYPEYRNYRGTSNCPTPLPENEFLKLARQYAFNESDANRLMLFTQLAQNNCMSVAQVMKLASLLNSEPNRLSLFRSAWPSIFDLGNLSYGSQLFAHIPNKAAYNDFINRTNQPPVIPCSISNNQLRDMLESIKKESFNSTKLTLARNIIQSNGCFSAIQIREIVQEFSFESGRLEIAKFGWNYVTDRENYYRVADAFSFSSTKEELMKYIENVEP